MITDNLELVVDALKKGKCVGLPTETVYGLGANAFNKKAVEKIFSIKGRPKKNPLILHTHSLKEVKKLVKSHSIFAYQHTMKLALAMNVRTVFRVECYGIIVILTIRATPTLKSILVGKLYAMFVCITLCVRTFSRSILNTSSTVGTVHRHWFVIHSRSHYMIGIDRNL